MEFFQVAFSCSSPSVGGRESGSRADLTLGQNPPSSRLSPDSRTAGGAAERPTALACPHLADKWCPQVEASESPISGALHDLFGLVTPRVSRSTCGWITTALAWADIRLRPMTHSWTGPNEAAETTLLVYVPSRAGRTRQSSSTRLGSARPPSVRL